MFIFFLFVLFLNLTFSKGLKITLDFFYFFGRLLKTVLDIAIIFVDKNTLVKIVNYLALHNFFDAKCIY